MHVEERVRKGRVRMDIVFARTLQSHFLDCADVKENTFSFYALIFGVQ